MSTGFTREGFVSVSGLNADERDAESVGLRGDPVPVQHERQPGFDRDDANAGFRRRFEGGWADDRHVESQILVRL